MIKFKVTQNGKTLPKSKYTWDEETKTFSTEEDNLVLDFNNSSGCTFKTGSGCTFKTGSDCTFKTGSGCTFDTGWGCTFKTGWGCTFKTGWGCTFKTGSGCVVVRKDTLEVIPLVKNVVFQLCPYSIKGFLTKKQNEDAFYMDIDGTRIEHIIADGILSKVIKKKGNIYHVQNHGSDKITYLIKDDDVWSHGETLKEAKEGLKYKISNRDTTKFEKYTLDDEFDQTAFIRMYRAITGACEGGTRYFCENRKLPKKCTIRKAIELTQGCYGNETFRKFFERESDNER